MSARRAALEQMIEHDPKNAFARYGLAMDLLNGGEAEAATKEFQTLLELSPDYAAGYFHGGRAYETLGQVDEARLLYQRGIEVTERTGDAHTRSELQTALDILG